MNELLDSAVAAHGGLDRWNRVKSIASKACHSRQQILCFGQDGLLRRHDFTMDNIILR